MSQPTVTHIAAARQRRTVGSPHFCQTCTAYTGRMGHGPAGCAGDAVTHVAATHPVSIVEHDHEESNT